MKIIYFYSLRFYEEPEKLLINIVRRAIYKNY